MPQPTLDQVKSWFPLLQQSPDLLKDATFEKVAVGHGSEVFKISLDYSQDPKKIGMPQKLVVKLGLPGDHPIQKFNLEQNAHWREKAFYENSVDKKFHPECYRAHVKGDEFEFVFADCTTVPGNMIKGNVSVKKMEKVYERLGEYHATYWKGGKGWNKMVESKNVPSQAKQELIDQYFGIVDKEYFFKTYPIQDKDVKALFEEMFEKKNYGHLMQQLTGQGKSKTAQFMANFQTIVHGDFHAFNQYLTEDGTPIFFDFQLIAQGPCMHDVHSMDFMFFLSQFTDLEEREKMRHQVLKHYSKGLKSVLGDQCPSEQDIWEACRIGFLSAIWRNLFIGCPFWNFPEFVIKLMQTAIKDFEVLCKKYDLISIWTDMKTDLE